MQRERNMTIETIKEVVFPVDFSERSVEVCPYVAALTRRLGATLTLVHVVENLPPGSSPLDRLYTEDQQELYERQNTAREALLAFQQQYIPQVPSRVFVLVGDPTRAIVDYGGNSTARIIVMPTRGFGPFRQMLIGSVTAKVLHDAKCPVLTGPHLERAIDPKHWFKLQRIICAVALDWETDEILEASRWLADQLGAELIVAHVITPVEEGLLPLVEPSGPPISTESVRQTMVDVVERLGVSARVEVLVGEASRRLASAARDLDADLVVIGKGGAPELPGRLGCHGYAIVRRAPCPVVCF
jgi:nucleotide-binding universal stress UspA family protein